MRKKIIKTIILTGCIIASISFIYTKIDKYSNLKLLTNTLNEELLTIDNEETKEKTVPLDNGIDNFKILNIKEIDHRKEKRDNKDFFILNCDLEFSYTHNNIKYNDSINTDIIFTKDEGTFEVLSIDDMLKGILKSINTVSSVKLTEVIDNMSLFYESSTLNYSVNYPEEYNMVSSFGSSEEEGNYETLTFTKIGDDPSKYLKLYTQEHPTSLTETTNDYLSNGYSKIDSKEFENYGYIVLENTFAKNTMDVTETIILTNKPIGNSKLTILTSVNTNIPTTDIEFILNSLKNSD